MRKSLDFYTPDEKTSGTTLEQQPVLAQDINTNNSSEPFAKHDSRDELYFKTNTKKLEDENTAEINQRFSSSSSFKVGKNEVNLSENSHAALVLSRTKVMPLAPQAAQIDLTRKKTKKTMRLQQARYTNLQNLNQNIGEHQMNHDVPEMISENKIGLIKDDLSLCFSLGQNLNYSDQSAWNTNTKPGE